MSLSYIWKYKWRLRGALGALLSTKKNQGGQATASLLASCKTPDQEGDVCDVEGCSPLSKVTETLGGGMGDVTGVGQGGIEWKEEQKGS